MLQLTEKVIRFILRAYEQGYISKRTAKIPGPHFHWMKSYLRDHGILKPDGYANDYTNEKKWILTEKGVKVAEKLKEIVEVLENG